MKKLYLIWLKLDLYLDFICDIIVRFVLKIRTLLSLDEE